MQIEVARGEIPTQLGAGAELRDRISYVHQGSSAAGLEMRGFWREATIGMFLMRSHRPTRRGCYR